MIKYSRVWLRRRWNTAVANILENYVRKSRWILFCVYEIVCHKKRFDSKNKASRGICLVTIVILGDKYPYFKNGGCKYDNKYKGYGRIIWF